MKKILLVGFCFLFLAGCKMSGTSVTSTVSQSKKIVETGSVLSGSVQNTGTTIVLTGSAKTGSVTNDISSKTGSAIIKKQPTNADLDDEMQNDVDEIINILDSLSE